MDYCDTPFTSKKRHLKLHYSGNVYDIDSDKDKKEGNDTFSPNL